MLLSAAWQQLPLIQQLEGGVAEASGRPEESVRLVVVSQNDYL
jgi:hypothetical protein